MAAQEHTIESNLHINLIKILNEARRLGARFRVTCSNRGREAQNKAKASGNSNAVFGKSSHNYLPALGLDFIPLDEHGKFQDSYWNDIQRFKRVADIFKQAAINLKIAIVWGGDWKSIKDYPHIELANWKEIRGILAP